MSRSFRSFGTTVPKVLLQPINDQGGGNYRILQPASLLRKHGYAVTQAHPFAVSPEQLQVLDPDVVVFQLFQTEQQQQRIKSYKNALPQGFLVYEIDDLFWAVPEDSFHRNNPLLPTAKSNIRVAAKLCDAINCSTPELAEEMKKLTGMKDIRVVPNHVPNSFINAALAGRRELEQQEKRKLRVGWAGGIGHGGDLKIISQVMREIGTEVQWVFLGMLPPDISPSEHVEYYQGVPFADYAKQLGRLNLDIALAPLQDNGFNRCKSDLRVLEYAAAGFPVIASDVTPYRNSAPDLHITANTVEDWVKTIRLFMADKELRETQAENLHQWVLKNRCMDNHLPERLKAYLPPKTEPFLPTLSGKHFGKVVTVGAVIEGLEHFATAQEAWQKMPGADIFYVRPHTTVTAEQAARIIQALGNAASASPVNNDGMYPAFGKFMPVPPDRAVTIDVAAQIANNDPIPCPFPAGPCVLLAGDAVAKFGLPDSERFGSLEYAMADWGSRCMEGGRHHVTVANTYVVTESPLVQPKDIAQRTLEHIHMWSPGFTDVLQKFQSGAPLTHVREDLELAFHAIDYKAPRAETYQDWYELFEQPNERDCVAMQAVASKWENPPKVSIIMPTYNTPIQWLKEAVSSVVNQTYWNWELVIVDDASTDMDWDEVEHILDFSDQIKIIRRTENGHIVKASNDGLGAATGDLLIFLDHDDTLAPHALFTIVREFIEHPKTQFVYSDSDKITADGKLGYPYFTPDFSYELLLAQNYVTHLCAYRLEVVKEIGGLTEGMEGSQDWDLVLRYLEKTCGNPPDPKLIRHIPHVLYHWRQHEESVAGNALAKPYAIEAGRKAVMAHLRRTNQNAFVAPHPVLPLFNLVRFLVQEPHPKVSILIPTKDNAEQLERCIESTRSQTLYSNYDILILDNGSTDSRTKNLLKRYGDTKGIRVLHMPGQFNYATMNNKAAAATNAEFLCLMNDDVEVVERAWLLDMIGIASRSKVGAVGAKLIYPDKTIQQCGTIFSPHQTPGQSALHAWQRLPMHDVGSTGRAVITQPYLAVTGACMVIRRSLWELMGGMDAVRFPVDWNDVDLCIRLHKAGYRNIVSAMSFMLHREGQSKKRLNNWRREQMLADEKRLLELHSDVRDPYINERLAFHPHMNSLKQEPFPRPWGEQDRSRKLLVNGTPELAKRLFTEGALPFVATIEGHYLVFSKPEMANVQPIDLRQSTHPLQVALAKLGITEVYFCGIGDGTLGAVGYFAALRDGGWPVIPHIISEVNTQNEFEYYDPTGWRTTWGRLLNAA